MNENFMGTNGNDNAQTSSARCERAEEIVSHLYGETTREEAARFDRHAATCAACRDELAAFAGVREVVGVWKQEAFQTASSFVPEPSATVASQNHFAPSSVAATRKRSAVAALREFFSLSPLWLQAGTVAATLLICALAALTLARSEIRWDADGFALQTGIPTRTVEVVKTVSAPAGKEFTQEQVNLILDEHKQQIVELQAQLQRQKENQPEMVVAKDTKSADSQSRPSAPRDVRNVRRNNVASNKTPRNRRLELAEGSDEDLPRLSDLLREVN